MTAVATRPARGVRPADVRRRVQALFTTAGGEEKVGRIGLEIEVIPVRRGGGLPLPLPVAELMPLLRGAGDLPLSFEPGGQLELSPGPEPSLAEALARVDGLMDRVAAALPGTALHAGGTNPWHTREELGLQTDRPRYRVMQAHFQALGPAGTRMMRQTAALQVSLDLGAGAAAGERWRLLNLAGPALTAAFANSPRLEGRETDLASTRCWIWQHTDASRTGFDMRQVGAPGAEADAYLAFALAAGVMPLPRDGADPEPTAAGLSLRAWLARTSRASGGADGRPDDADVEHHLTTLFPPVRPRSGDGGAHLEVRYLDALPRTQAEVAVAVLAALAYVPRARHEALELLEPAPRGRAAWAAAAEHGLRDPATAGVALPLLEIARQGLDDLPSGYLGPHTAANADAYLERFTRAHRTPADEALERAHDHPEEPLPWK